MAGSGMMAPSTPVEEPKQDPKKTMMAGSGTMELQRAQAELKRSQAETRKAQAEAKKAAAESKKLAAELKTAEQKHQVAGRRVQQLDKTVETMRKQAENQRGELDALRSQLLKARAEAEELGERLTHKPSTKAGVGSDPAQLLENAQAEAQRLRTALDQSQHELVALRAELEDMQSEEPTKIKKRPVAEGEKALREQLDSVCKERDALKKATETQLQRMRELEKELDAKSGDEITQLKTRVATQADQLEDHQSKAAHWRSEAETLARQLEDQKALEAEVEELKARLAAADNKLERAERLEVERYELKDQVETLAERIKDLEALEKLADEHASLKLQAESVRRKEDDFERLKDEKATLAEKMMMLEKERDALKQEIDGHKNAQDDRTDLALRINVLEEQLRELEQLREDNLRLKSHREENESLRKEIEQLQEDNANYQSLELVAKAPPKPKITFEESSEDEGMGNTLQRLVEKLSQDISGRATVLADELGLVVAGIGDNADAMAAVSAIFAEINGRIRGVLPLGRLQQLLLVDENQLTYSAQPFKAVGGELVLATLTAGLPPTRERLIELLGPQQDK
jgi:chromosome segregation ATPase